MEGRFCFVDGDIRHPKFAPIKLGYSRGAWKRIFPDKTVRYPKREQAECARIALEHYACTSLEVVQV